MMKKKIALAALMAALAGTAGAQVQTIDLTATPYTVAPAPATAPAAAHAVQVVVPAQYLVSSELPEPEVFLMMLVGLLLIGVRAGKVSHEKFEQ